MGPQSGTILPSGTTTIQFIITDAGGNVTACSVDITNDFLLSVDVVGNDVLCFGENSGSAIANVTGSNPGFTYLWSTGDTTQQIDNLSPGNYNVIVTDSGGCEIFGEVDITEPSSAVAFSVGMIIDESAPGQSDGSIELTVTGGTPPYLSLIHISEPTRPY